MSETSPAGVLADRLQAELVYVGITCVAREYQGVALVSIGSGAGGWVDVWVEFGPEGWRYRWWTGRVSAAGLWEYTFCPASAVETAARRVAVRVREIRECRVPTAVLADIAAAQIAAGEGRSVVASANGKGQTT